MWLKCRVWCKFNVHQTQHLDWCRQFGAWQLVLMICYIWCRWVDADLTGVKYFCADFPGGADESVQRQNLIPCFSYLKSGRNSGWIEFWGGAAAGSDVTNADNGFHSLARQLRCNHFWNHISWSGCLATWCHFFWQAESVRMWWWEGIISQTNWQVSTSISITVKSPSFSLVVCENVNWALPSSCAKCVLGDKIIGNFAASCNIRESLQKHWPLVASDIYYS